MTDTDFARGKWFEDEAKKHTNPRPPSYRRKLDWDKDAEIRLIVDPHEKAMKRRAQDVKEWAAEDAKGLDAELEIGHGLMCPESDCSFGVADDDKEGMRKHLREAHHYTESQLEGVGLAGDA